MSERFSMFSEEARRVLSHAQEEAQRYNHKYVGTQHLLLGMLHGSGSSIATRVLINMRLQLPRLRDVAERAAVDAALDGTETHDSGLTSIAKTAIERAVVEARRRDTATIGPEHLLLGLLEQEGCAAIKTLEAASASPSALRQEVINILNQTATAPDEIAPDAPPKPATLPRPGSFGGREKQLTPARNEKFTERARKAVTLALEESRRLNQNGVGPEHLLVGLIREADGVAGRVLQSMGVELPKVRESIIFSVGREDRAASGDSGLTADGRRVIELAADEARRLNHSYIGTEHLLLGLVRQNTAIIAGVLESLAVSPDAVRREVLRVLAQSPFAVQHPPDIAVATFTSAGKKYAEPPLTRASAMLTAQSAAEVLKRFDPEAMQMLELAKAESRRFNHNFIGTEHLLLGLIAQDGSVAVDVLRDMGRDVEKIRRAVEFIIGRGDRSVAGEIGLSPRAGTVVVLAGDEAAQMGSQSIGTEHLLIGCVREGEGIAAGVLESQGVTLDKVRAATRRVLDAKQSAALQKESTTPPPAPTADATQGATGNVFVSNHPLIQHKLGILRNRMTEPKRFREVVSEISTLLAYEATAGLQTRPVTIETPLAEAQCQELDEIVGLVPILRSGIGMVDPFLQMLPTAQVWHIGLYREHDTLQPVQYYNKLPGHTPTDLCLVLDPMLATGGSAEATISLLKEWGARRIIFVGLIGAPEGVRHLQQTHPDVPIYLAAIDDHLNDVGYIVPGLGDAGDRQFGTL